MGPLDASEDVCGPWGVGLTFCAQCWDREEEKQLLLNRVVERARQSRSRENKEVDDG